MSSALGSDSVARRSGRPRRAELVLVVPRWAPWVATVAVILSLVGAFAIGWWWGRRSDTTSPPAALSGLPEAQTEYVLELGVEGGASSISEDEGDESDPRPSEPAAVDPSAATEGFDEDEAPQRTTEWQRAPPSGRWGVQIGSYPSRAEAVAALDPWGTEQRVFVTTVELQDKGTWYRVRIGAFAKKESARRLARRVFEATQERPLVVQYP